MGSESSPMEAPDSKQPESQNLYERVIDKVNADSIKALLAKAKDDTQGDFGTSGNTEELVDHLKRAVGVGSLTSERVYSLLQEAEENGGQTILYYVPKTEGTRQLCSDPDEVARRLFGADWRNTAGFPLLPRLDTGWEIVDFRTPYSGKASDWLMKVYTFQESKVQVKNLEGEEVQFALKLKKNEYAVVYERRVIESVCIARWNSHGKTPLLELRIELAGRLPRFKIDINALWSRLKPAFEQEDFELWELRDLLQKMLRECQDKTDIYQIGLVNLKDSGEGNVRYTPYTEHEPIDTNPTRSRWLNPPAMVWVASPSSHVQWTTRIRPFERLRHRHIVILDETQDPITQVILRSEHTAAKHSTTQNAEPNLHLVQPRRMFWNINKTHTMTRITQKRLACRHRFQDSALPLHAERFQPNPTQTRDQKHQGRRTMRRQVVRHKDPTRTRIGCNRLLNVGRKIDLAAGLLHRRSDHLTARHLEVADEHLRAVPGVLDLTAFDPTGSHRLGRSLRFEGLNARLLIDANRVNPLVF